MLRKFMVLLLFTVAAVGMPIAIVSAAKAPMPAESVATGNPSLMLVQDTEPGEELPPLDPDPKSWFDNPLAFAAAIAAVVAFIKAHLFALGGIRTVIASLIVGVLASVLGTLDLPLIGRVNDRELSAAVVYGAQAAIIASGGWDVIKGLLLVVFGGKREPEA